MADNNTVEILIRFGLDPAKAREAAKELDGLKAKSKEAGDAGVEAQTKVKEATDKTFTSSKQLKDAVKQLGHEFPVLGQLGRLAMNPITAAVAGITTAFVIWKYRTDELTESMAGLELPDVGESQVSRIERLGGAYGVLAAKLVAIKTDAPQVKKALDEATRAIEFNDAFKRALGIDTAGAGAAEKAGVTGMAADALRKRGQAMISGAGKVMTPEEEKSAGELAKKNAEAAQVALAESRLWSGDIAEFISGEMPFIKRPIFGAKFAARYGTPPHGKVNEFMAEALAKEQSNAAGYQGIIDQYGRFQLASGDRAARRAQIEAGRGLISDADAMGIQATELGRSSILSRASSAATALRGAEAAVGSAAGAGNLPGAAAAMMEMARDIRVLADAILAARNESRTAVQKISSAGLKP